MQDSNRADLEGLPYQSRPNPYELMTLAGELCNQILAGDIDEAVARLYPLNAYEAAFLSIYVWTGLTGLIPNTAQAQWRDAVERHVTPA